MISFNTVEISKTLYFILYVSLNIVINVIHSFRLEDCDYIFLIIEKFQINEPFLWDSLGIFCQHTTTIYDHITFPDLSSLSTHNVIKTV